MKNQSLSSICRGRSVMFLRKFTCLWYRHTSRVSILAERCLQHLIVINEGILIKTNNLL